MKAAIAAACLLLATRSAKAHDATAVILTAELVPATDLAFAVYDIAVWDTVDRSVGVVEMLIAVPQLIGFADTGSAGRSVALELAPVLLFAHGAWTVANERPSPALAISLGVASVIDAGVMYHWLSSDLESPKVTLAPMPLRDGGGLVVAGRF
jgi:hypothetical protein